MSFELAKLISRFESLWPVSGAEEWDTPGLVCGDHSQRVSRVLLTVDITAEIVEEAIDGGFDLILAHHPFLLRGITSASEETSKGRTLAKAIRSNVSIYAAHTNADIVLDGVSDVLAKALGLGNATALVSSQENVARNNLVGHGRIGTLEQPLQLGDFARVIARVLPSTASGVRVAGDYEQMISTVAVCGGAGDSFIGAAQSAGADVFVTADLRHHPAQDSKEQSLISEKPMALIDVSHWASEWLWLEVAAAQLADEFSDAQFVVSQLRTDPWDFVVTQ
jgi:dinuclear metal center YbgI/SA1388 family protein